jgi:hypothetical protein
MGRNGAQRARYDFSPRRIAAETAAVYREALEQAATIGSRAAG